MAVKIVRQPKKIALIGAPSSAAAFAPGTEKAPAAFRAAGLVERLQAAGYEVADYGDCPPRLFAADDEHRRARNLPAIVAGLNDLKPHVELAAKSGAFVLVLGGDCAQAIGVLTGLRRYHKHINLLWFDRDADLNTPASTPSGRIDGMVVAHIIGRGAPELVRFWGEPPLVREPDVTLFGLERLDPPEQEVFNKTPLHPVFAVDIQAKGATAAAIEALGHLHADAREFALHFDLDVIAQEEFPAVNVPGSGGLSFNEVRAAFVEFVKHKNLLGLDVAQYNPDKDPDGSGARKVVDLLVEALTARLEPHASPAAPTSAETVEAAETVAEPAPQSQPPARASTETAEEPEPANPSPAGAEPAAEAGPPSPSPAAISEQPSDSASESALGAGTSES